ncbi:MAG: lipocalin-like domain-containing protein [Candidatus Acidiferrum sp.]
MKSSAGALGLLLVSTMGFAQQTPYKLALPGYHYEFPRDNFSHPDFQTEWWYYTGNLTAKNGRRFGFELTFFRIGVNRDAGKDNTWDLRDLYLAHLALSDISGKTFYHTERTNRAGPGIAGVDAEQGRNWNGNWSATWKGSDQVMRAMDPNFAFTLTLHPKKPPVIHGQNGVSQKGEGPGRASHYISLTRLETNGSIELNGQNYPVSGLAWMDHEFFTNQLGRTQVGWDWVSLQLSDDTELMLYRFRRTDGTVDPYSSGTYIDANGRAFHLSCDDFSLTPTDETWRSPVTGAVYPVHWTVLVPKLNIAVEVTTQLKSQELAGKSNVVPNYWEGAIDVNGREGQRNVTGVGYLEMTGYDRAVKLGQ